MVSCVTMWCCGAPRLTIGTPSFRHLNSVFTPRVFRHFVGIIPLTRFLIKCPVVDEQPLAQTSTKHKAAKYVSVPRLKLHIGSYAMSSMQVG